ncbi:MAG: hypothetical protein PHQ64_04440 [Bacilli bacterium]|nr:hypothetical protein [Bacilli bacterium]
MKNKEKNKILLKILYIIILLPFFQIPYFVDNYAKIPTIYNILNIFSYFSILVLVLKSRSYSKIINYLILFLAILTISSIINKTANFYAIKDILNILFLCLIVDYGTRKDSTNFFKSLSLILTTLVYINFLTIFLNPTGMYSSKTGYIENWFLGYKNTHILFIIPAIMFSFLCEYKEDKKLSFPDYLLLAVSIISTIKVNNGTGLIGIFIITIFILSKKVFDNKTIFNIKNYIITYIASFLLIVFFRAQNIFSYLIVDILGKDITFTGRTFIWDKALLYIKQKPLLGYGNVSFEFNKYIFSTHNAILGILHKTGIIGLTAFVIFVLKGINPLWKNRDKYISKFVSIVIFSYLLMMITESYNFIYYIYIFIVSYNIKYLIRGDTND